MSKEEVAAAISKLTANTAYSRDGSLARGMALSECIAAGDWRLYDRIDEAVRRVTPADVERVAKRYLTEDQRVTGWFVPTDESAAQAATSSADEPVSHPQANSYNENGNAPKSMGNRRRISRRNESAVQIGNSIKRRRRTVAGRGDCREDRAPHRPQ